MRQDHRFRKKKGLSDDQRRILAAAVIPAIVVVLMVVIVIADHAKAKKNPAVQDPTVTVSADAETGVGQEGKDPEVGGQTEEADPETEASETGETGTEQSEEMEFEDPFETEDLRKDSVPELLDLMQRYFRARAVADAETMNQLYGIGEVPAETLEEQKALMRSNAKYVSGFKNITTYVMDGAAADTWLVYALADIKFYSAKNAAPMIMWCYVQKDAEGTYTIVDNSWLTAEAAAFIEQANHSEAIRRLAADVNGRLKTALEENEDLSAVYGVLREGSPVWQQEAETEPAVVVLEEETQEPDAGESGESEPEQSASSEPEQSETGEN